MPVRVFRFQFSLAIGGGLLACACGPLPFGGGSVIPSDRYARLVVDLVAPVGKGIALGSDGPSCSDGDPSACGDDPSRLDTGLAAPGNSCVPEDFLTEIERVAQCPLMVRPLLHVHAQERARLRSVLLLTGQTVQSTNVRLEQFYPNLLYHRKGVLASQSGHSSLLTLLNTYARRAHYIKKAPPNNR